MSLPPNIENHALSGMDALGRLFWSGDNLLRGISPSWASFYDQLLKDGKINRLIQKGFLVNTKTSEFSSEAYPLVIEHEVLPVVSYASEWCACHFRAAALAILDFEIELRKESLTLWDLSPWNIVFDRSRPVWVDFTSIHPLQDTNEWRAGDQFHRFFLNPLILFQEKLPRFARRMMFDAVVGIRNEEILCVTKPTPQPAAVTVSDIKFTAAPPRSPEETLAHLRNVVATMHLASDATQWEGYHDDYSPPLTMSDMWTDKHRSMDQIFSQTKPKSVLDIGSNRGWYSRLAVEHGAEIVIAADTDDPSINALFRDTQSSGLPIYPIYLDIRLPEPAYGPAYKLFASAADRFKSDMVVALAITHHLVFTYYMTFEQIFDTLNLFSRRWLVVEFVSTGDVVVSKGLGWNEEYFPWYTEGNFRKSLEKHFRIIATLSSDWGGVPNKGGPDGPMDRKIFLCEKPTA